ncbi:MAG: bifunctional DNA-formamidopyrimidine glycosylase/DNA-(apurinic or apyrimidinic site) lyase [Acidimicrobiales bacterium]
MPELPEVETIRRQLEPWLVGRTVVDAGSHPSAKFAPAIEVVGARLESVARRGKFLLIGLDDNRELIVHLGMTGQLLPTTDLDDPYLRAWWRFDNGELLGFRDVRRFGRIRVVHDRNYEGTLASQGPEPFSNEFTPESLWAAIKASNRHVKTQLLSQRPVAGVGNIYADEACFLARVHPAARNITRKQAAALHGSIVSVLRQAVDNGGTTLRDYVNVEGATGENQHHLHCYGRYGEPCVDCGTELRRTTLDARTTTYCPICQRR